MLNVQALLLCVDLYKACTRGMFLTDDCRTFQSMLASCKKKELPADNDRCALSRSECLYIVSDSNPAFA